MRDRQQNLIRSAKHPNIATVRKRKFRIVDRIVRLDHIVRRLVVVEAVQVEAVQAEAVQAEIGHQ